MSQNSAFQNTTPKSSGKKAGKTSISDFLDDAPLFAGLDDYILKQTAAKETEGAKAAGTKKEKAKTVRQQPKLAQTPLPKNETTRKKPAVEDTSPLLSVTEMCALLKISRATLVRMDKSGQLPGRIKLGGSVRFHRETIDNWLKSLIASSSGRLSTLPDRGHQSSD